MTPTSPAEQADDLRAMLRRRTAEAHRRLDAAPGQRAVLRPSVADDAYASFLAGHLDAHRASEAELARVAWAAPEGLPAYRSRLPALRSDLAGLPGVRPRRAEAHGHATERASGYGATRPEDALGRYLGLRYVLDGATQGAEVIAPRLARHRPDLFDRRWAYWSLLEREAASWPALAAVLAEHPAEGPVADAALAGALDGFDAFLDVFAPSSDASVEPLPWRTS